MKICFEYGGKNPFTAAKTKSMITLEQAESGRQFFRVTYGLERDEYLTYAEACCKLGQVILHYLCCEDRASNEGA